MNSKLFGSLYLPRSTVHPLRFKGYGLFGPFFAVLAISHFCRGVNPRTFVIPRQTLRQYARVTRRTTVTEEQRRTDTQTGVVLFALSLLLIPSNHNNNSNLGGDNSKNNLNNSLINSTNTNKMLMTTKRPSSLCTLFFIQILTP